MADDFAQLLATGRFAGEQSWVRPLYEGQCTINLINSLLSHFGIAYGTPLMFHDAFAASLAGKRKIIFCFIDGLGWLNIEQAGRHDPVITDFFAAATRWPLTTVSPSTTSTASASFLTALPPAEHGILGYLMYFPEYRRVFNMLTFRAADAQQGDLLSCGFQPEQFLTPPTLSQLFDGAGVMFGAYTFAAYAGSGLSRLLYRNHLPHPFVAFGDLFSLVLQQLPLPVPQFHYLYWATLDTLGHSYGTHSEAYRMELRMLVTALREQILPRLDAETALIITADHGQIDGNDAEAVDLAAIPGLIDTFRSPPAGEGRATQLFIRSGEIARARELLQQTGLLYVMTQQEYLESGLLGHASPHPGIAAYIGDLIVFPYGSRRTLYPYEARPHTAMVGRHGGLSAEEMVAPLAVF